jgi:protein O-GlcNAc transferase
MSAIAPSGANLAEAIALWRAGKQQQAQLICEELLVGQAGDADALSLLAELCAASGQRERAVDSLQRLARLRPADAAIHRRLGNALLAADSAAAAVVSYHRAVALEPVNVRAHNNLGQALMQLGRLDEASASYERALELDPAYAIAHNNLGIVCYQQRDYARSLACYQRALELQPSFAEAQYNCGNALLRLKQPQQALEHYERALALRPSAEGLFNRANAMAQLKRHEAALDSFERALQLEPDYAEALSNCANTLLILKRPEDALRCCERALELKPGFTEAHNNHGGALRALHRYEEAIGACEEALRLKPDYALAWSNLANVSLAMNRRTEAIAQCDRAIECDPELAEAHEQRAWALVLERRHEEAAHSYARLLRIEPARPFVPGSALGAKLACCDWSGYEQACEQLAGSVLQDARAVSPFSFLNICESAPLQLRCARAFAADQMPRSCRQPWSGAVHQHERIRVAYLSADFHQHATAMLAAGLFEAHDRERFEISAVSFGADDASPMRARLQRAFERFIDVRRMGDAQVVQLMRSLEIDIAVDLKGYTGENRMGIFSRRAAPIQVSYLGYPGTLGLEQIDYILADRIVLPSEQQDYYSEQVVYLPECYQVNDDQRLIADGNPSRAEFGLPADGFVFCCFNNNHKISPLMFEVWMRLLRDVPDSVLWLLQDNTTAARNLRREAERCGVAAERLVFAPRMPAEQHLARHRVADLFLDTLPYNAHTTSSDALWAGLPVLTCLGSAFPGRVAASLLHAVGLPELVATSLSEYTTRALELAGDAARLRELRERLACNRTTYPLFDTVRFSRHLEAAYASMWQRYQQDEPPQGFAVPVTEPSSVNGKLAG